MIDSRADFTNFPKRKAIRNREMSQSAITRLTIANQNAPEAVTNGAVADVDLFLNQILAFNGFLFSTSFNLFGLFTQASRTTTRCRLVRIVSMRYVESERRLLSSE